MSEVFELTVPNGIGKLRLDAFCCSVLTGMTRSQLKTGIQAVQLNERQAKLSSMVQAGDRITLIWENPLPDVLIPEPIPLRVLYEDNDVIVVNKRAGMVTHPAAGNWTGTLVQALAYYRLHTSPIHDAFACLLEAEQGRGNFAELLRAGIVHRLDKDTSGILITARSAEAEAFLKNEFKLRRTEKYYLAILNGIPEKLAGIIETSVFRDGHSRIRFAASADLSKGKYACSRYKVLRVYGRYALVLFKIDTGRTHQIRLHARFIGCPIVGDPLYGKKETEWKEYGLMLHAYRLGITLPSTQKKPYLPPRRPENSKLSCAFCRRGCHRGIAEAPMQKNIDMVMAAFDYNRAEPCIVRETDHWAVVYKPPHLPTAPLRADERNTLVYWFLHSPEAEGDVLFDDMQTDALLDATQIDPQEPPAEYGRDIQEVQVGNKPAIRPTGRRIREAQVRGKKAIEAGLLHRLDTDTRGLVLFAKDQVVYDFLAARQEAGQMIKTYCAFVEPNGAPEIDDGYDFDATELSMLKELSAAQGQVIVQERIAAQLPLTLESQFRNFGPGAKRVAPVVSGSRHYKKDGRLYTTVIETSDILPSPIDGNDTVPETVCESLSPPPLIRLCCRLSRGYRHQVRAHLAAAGLPIVGDPLYAPQGAEAPPEAAQVSLQLYAVSLAFPDPENPQQNIRVALPLPDRMNP